jgi:hypothetical protein
MYKFSISFLLIVTIFLLSSVVVGSTVQATYSETSTIDLAKARTYQIDGNSMRHLGFENESFVDVVLVDEPAIGDVVAFECFDEVCEGGYIKELTQKQGTCYWFEGRKDIWEEDGQKKQSMDSRTTYGWLCDEEVKILGVAFIQEV